MKEAATAALINSNGVSLTEIVKAGVYCGRHVVKTDISPFIRNLPFREDTSAFTTENASGSTSQAVNTSDAIEMACKGEG